MGPPSDFFLILGLVCGLLVDVQAQDIVPPTVTTPPLAVSTRQVFIELSGCDALVSEIITYEIDDSIAPVAGFKHYVDMLGANELVQVTVKGFTSGADAITVWSEPNPLNEDEYIITWDIPPTSAPVTFQVNYTLSAVTRSYSADNSFNYNLVNRGITAPQITSIDVLSVEATAMHVGQIWQITPDATTSDITGGTQFTWENVSLGAEDPYHISLSFPIQMFTCQGAPKRWAKSSDDESLLDKILAFLRAYWFIFVLVAVCCVCCIFCMVIFLLLVFGIGGLGAGGVAYKVHGGDEDEFDY